MGCACLGGRGEAGCPSVSSGPGRDSGGSLNPGEESPRDTHRGATRPSSSPLFLWVAVTRGVCLPGRERRVVGGGKEGPPSELFVESSVRAGH